jgi:hypothetical protein
LRKHNEPDDEYCFPSFQHLSLAVTSNRISSTVTATRSLALAIECGLVAQLNGDESFGFCRAALDTIALGFCSMGRANNPASWR